MQKVGPEVGVWRQLFLLFLIPRWGPKLALGDGSCWARFECRPLATEAPDGPFGAAVAAATCQMGVRRLGRVGLVCRGAAQCFGGETTSTWSPREPLRRWLGSLLQASW